MKPTVGDYEKAVARLTVLKFFPTEDIARASIMELLLRMVGTTHALDWLVRTMIDHVGVWDGTAQLRALFCVRFKPADGVEGKEKCKFAGFTEADLEAEYQRRIQPSVARNLLLDGNTGAVIADDGRAERKREELERRYLEDGKIEARKAILKGTPEWLKNLA